MFTCYNLNFKFKLSPDIRFHFPFQKMEPRKKRKLENKDTPSQCIIHASDVTVDEFTFISNTKDPHQRFTRIREIKQLRQSQPLGSPNRKDDICNQIPEEYHEGLGYHRTCYARFTTNLSRIKNVAPQQKTSETTLEMRSSLNKDTILFHLDCIFCNSTGKKALKKGGVWTTEDLCAFDRHGDEQISSCAKNKSDYKLLGRISVFNLFSCEAKYHPSCRRAYIRDPDRSKSRDDGNVQRQKALEEAHSNSFQKVCQFIDKDIIVNGAVVKLTELCKIYISHLHETEFPNPNYRCEKLKKKLENCERYKGLLGFCPILENFNTYLVFSRKIELSDAIRRSYQLGLGDKVIDVAESLRQEIIHAFQNVDNTTWPLMVKDLEPKKSVVPDILDRFLTVVLGGGHSPTAKIRRLVNSIGQDILRAVTNGKWKLPKHVILGMSLRHLFRSAELISILNRLGHTENYCFLLELETALATAIDQTSGLLSPQIIRNPSCPQLFHSDFDNFDEYINDIGGAGSVHRSQGIMLQEILPDTSEEIGGWQPEIPNVEKTGERSLKWRPEPSLPECSIGVRKNPVYEILDITTEEGRKAQDRVMLKNILWVLARLHSSQTNQDVPGWGGYVSITGNVPARLTTIDYYPIIPYPITDIDAVAECLRYSEEGARQVGQRYVITTFDLGACMKALPLVWGNMQRYKDHIIMIGTFHLACAYMKMLGKKMEGSGFSDILLEAGLITSGSLKGVTSGTNYSRSLHCHKVLVESLERLILAQFLEMSEQEFLFQTVPQSSMDCIRALIHGPSRDTEAAVLQDPRVCSYINNYMQFRDAIRAGKLGKTAILWISYVDHVWLLLSLMQAVKTNDFDVYIECISQMPDLFFSFGGQNYARYLTYFAMFMINVEVSHPGASELLRRGAISVARSFVPGSRCAVDKTIEETVMKHSKSRGGSGASGAGLSGIQNNYEAYQRWTKTTKERAKFLQATYNLAGMVDETHTGQRHRETHVVDINRSERQVLRTVAAIKCFNDPFNIADKNTLYCISSGAPASADVEIDVLQAESAGHQAKDEFIKERLTVKEKFFDPIKRLNLKTLASMGISVKLTTSAKKTVEYKQQGNVAFQLLAKSQNHIEKLDLRKLLQYSLTPVPYSIGLADGSLAKTDKSKALHYLTKDANDSDLSVDPINCMIIEDGNALFHSLKEIPSTFGGIALKILSNVVVHSSPVIFSTDMYSQYSIKSGERLKRGCGDKLIVSGESTKRPKNWKTFLYNDDNKTQLVNVLLKSWRSDSSAGLLDGHKVTLICEGEGYDLTSDGVKTYCMEVPSLKSTQEETDSRVVLYCLHARDNGFKFVKVRSPDTDIFFILLHHARILQGITVLFQTGKGTKRKCIDISTMAESLTPVVCSALLGLHAFSGCDSTSAFRGKGKVKAIKILFESEKYVKAFSLLGNTWNAPMDSLLEVIEPFVCEMYGNSRITSVNELRFVIMQRKCGGEKEFKKASAFDLSALPPCQNVLIQHLNRVNYQVAIWKCAHEAQPSVPNPTDGHGWTVEHGITQPLWTDKDVLPKELVDILEETLQETNDASDMDDDEVESEGFTSNSDDSEGEEDNGSEIR